MSAGGSIPERAMVIGRPFPKGISGNPSGKTRRVVEIERMLDEDHRGVEHMRPVFARLRALALGEVVTVTGRDGDVDIELKADPAFMKLYLDRLLGPVKARDAELDDAIEGKLMELIAEAKRRRDAGP